MTLTFYRYGSTDATDTLELDETKSSIIDKLNEPTRLSAILTSETAPQIALGNYTTYKGTRYYVTKEPTVRKEHSQLYTVEVDLERSIGLGRITILANPVDHRTTFDYTGTATEHLQLIIDCLNAKYEEVELKWTRGAVHCKDTIKHIKYDGATVLGALQQIRETYETDIFAAGETLSLGQEEDKTTALPLAYGKGKGLLSGLERHKHTDDTVPTRLYVTGTKRNMTKGRLTLEKDVILSVDLKSGAIERVTGGVPTAGGRSYYRTDPTGQYIAEWSSTDKFFQSSRRFPTEATYTNEEIYPSHVSTIKSVTKVKDHYEVNSDFNYDKFRIAGEQMQVVFQTGNLAGRDFDAKYYPSTGRLAIVPKEEDDTTLPSDILCPKVGDQYIVTGIKLPDQYIREAERNLTDEALRHLIKLQETRYSYKADIDPVYLHNNHDKIAPQLAVGRYVRLTDPQIAIGDPYVRIVGKRTYLDRPYTPEIELSNEIEPRSELTRVLNDLDRQDEGLASILERLRQSGLVLSDLTLSSNAMRQRVEAAEEALAGKQPKGSYVDPSQLDASKQQAVAEAVKQAEELDKKLKVGGRNLFRNKYFIGDLASRYEIPFDALQPREGDNTYTLSLDYKVSPEDKASSPRITCFYSNNGGELFWDKDIKRDGEWHHKEYTIQIKETDPSKYPIRGWFTDYGSANGRTIDMVSVRNIKLERGTVATDWTPAPEDVAESVSKVSKSLEELSDHPLTVDDNGYWQIWSVKDNKYVTTQYQSRGRDGQDAGRYLGRAKRIHPDLNGNYLLEPEGSSWLTAKEGDYVYLVGDLSNRGGDKDTYYIVREHTSKTVWEVYNIKGRIPVLTLDSQHHLLADGEMVSMQSLKGEAGHTPELHVGEDDYLYVDGVKQRYLRGQRGEDGHNPSPEDVLKTESFKTLLGGEVTSQVKPVADDLELTKQTAINAEAGVTQALDDLDATKRSIGGEISDLLGRTDDLLGRTDNINAELSTTKLNLEGAKTDIAAALNKADAAEGAANDASAYARNVDGKLTRTNNKLTATNNKLTTATNNIADLSSRSLTRQQKEDLTDITDSLQVLRNTDGSFKEVALQRYIALSGNGKDISAYLASNALPAVLKAGITNFGTPQEREEVAINHNGTGHLGNLYFAGNQIDFRTDEHTDPYLSIGAEESQFIGDFLRTARVDQQVVYASSVTLTTSTTSYERTVDVANDGTRLTVTIDSIKIETYGSAKTRLTLDGEVLAEWRGKEYKNHGGSLTGGDIEITQEPYTASDLSYERVVKAGRHAIRLEIVQPTDGATANIKELRVRRRYDTGAQQSLLTKSGLRLFGSPDRYLDVDYRTTYRAELGNGRFYYYHNDYLVRIKGGAKVDKLTADELDVPGAPLCGASFDGYGTKIKSFGKRAKRQGQSVVQAVYDYSIKAYKVYHSIGNTDYIPIVQVSGWVNDDINWSLTPRVYDIKSDYFVVRILSNNDNPHNKPISYVAYKTE